MDQLYSQHEEDGIIWHLISKISKITELSKTFIEFGCGNGVENNTHALLLRDGFKGVWIDGSDNSIEFIKSQLGGIKFNRLNIIKEFVTLDSINNILNQCNTYLNTSDIDFLSMDHDGNDWHFIKECLKYINPKIICVEYNVKFPPPLRMVIDYNPSFYWHKDDYFGASLQSYVDMLQDYNLVCCETSGCNAFFIRKDLSSIFTIYPIEMLYYTYINLPPLTWGHKPSLKWLNHILSM